MWRAMRVWPESKGAFQVQQPDDLKLAAAGTGPEGTRMLVCCSSSILVSNKNAHGTRRIGRHMFDVVFVCVIAEKSTLYVQFPEVTNRILRCLFDCSACQ